MSSVIIAQIFKFKFSVVWSIVYIRAIKFPTKFSHYTTSAAPNSFPQLKFLTVLTPIYSSSIHGVFLSTVFAPAMIHRILCFLRVTAFSLSIHHDHTAGKLQVSTSAFPGLYSFDSLLLITTSLSSLVS